MQLSQKRFLHQLASYGLTYDELVSKFHNVTVSGWRLNDDCEFELDGCTVTEKDYIQHVSFVQCRFDYI